MVESRLHLPPFSHILYEPHLNRIKQRLSSRWFQSLLQHKELHTDLVLDGHDGVVPARVDVQDVVVVAPAQVVGDVGEGGAARLRHAVVDDHHVVFVVRQRGRRRVPQAVLQVPLLDLSYLVARDGLFWRRTGEEIEMSAGHTGVCLVVNY